MFFTDMRNKNKRLLKLKLQEGDFPFVANLLSKRFLIPLSKSIKRPLCGPLLASLVVTYRCNADCIMCDFPSRGDRRKEYTLEQWKKIVDDLAALGTTSVSCSGGEPLLWKDIFELVRYARKKGLLTQMPTNGQLLNEENARKLIDSGLHAITISLDGSTPEIHDSVRNTPGLFNKAVEGAKLLLGLRDKKHGLPIISFSSVITEKNVADLPNIVRLAEDIGVDNISFFSAEGVDGDTNGNFYRRAQQFIQWVEQQRRGGLGLIDNSETSSALLMEKYQGKQLSIPCYADYGTIFIDCFGNVFPCNMFLNEFKAVANLQDSSIKTLWRSSAYSKVRKSIRDCRKCHYVCQIEINGLFKKKAIDDRQ